MKNYGKGMLVLLLLHGISQGAVKPIDIGAKLHQIIPHQPQLSLQSGVSLQKLLVISSEKIAQMTKSLKAIEDLEKLYKKLLTKDAQQTLTEFKTVMSSSIESQKALLSGIELYLKDAKQAQDLKNKDHEKRLKELNNTIAQFEKRFKDMEKAFSEMIKKRSEEMDRVVATLKDRTAAIKNIVSTLDEDTQKLFEHLW